MTINPHGTRLATPPPARGLSGTGSFQLAAPRQLGRVAVVTMVGASRLETRGQPRAQPPRPGPRPVHWHTKCQRQPRPSALPVASPLAASGSARLLKLERAPWSERPPEGWPPDAKAESFIGSGTTLSTSNGSNRAFAACAKTPASPLVQSSRLCRRQEVVDGPKATV